MSEPLDDRDVRLAAALAHRLQAVAAAACARARAAASSSSRAPVAPSGWPSAIAPPFTLTRARSASSSFCHASTTDANASLISTRSMSVERSCRPSVERVTRRRDRRGQHPAPDRRARTDEVVDARARRQPVASSPRAPTRSAAPPRRRRSGSTTAAVRRPPARQRLRASPSSRASCRARRLVARGRRRAARSRGRSGPRRSRASARRWLSSANAPCPRASMFHFSAIISAARNCETSCVP